MDLLQALQALDDGDDAQWTAQGLPKVDVLKEMTGDESITRQVIDGEAPDYTRTNRYDLGSDDETTEEVVSVDDVADVDAVADVDQPEEGGDAHAKLVQQRDAMKALLKQRKLDRRDLDHDINQLQSELNGLEAIIAAVRPQLSPTAVVKQYQEAQKVIREEAAGLPENRRSSPLSTVGVSQLDRVHAARRRAARSRVGVPTQIIGSKG